MEIIFTGENEDIFGSTKMLGIARRQPELIYGKKAKELRESANLTIEQLASTFKMKPFDIERIEEQKQALSEKIFEKYCSKFNVNKEYFFDLDLETLIADSEGHVIKSFKDSKTCKKVFNELKVKYFDAVAKNENLIVNFNELEK